MHLVHNKLREWAKELSKWTYKEEGGLSYMYYVAFSGVVTISHQRVVRAFNPNPTKGIHQSMSTSFRVYPYMPFQDFLDHGLKPRFFESVP